MADRKISTLPKADALTSTDAGCLLHLTGRMGKQGRNMRVVPLATLLWEAYAG